MTLQSAVRGLFYLVVALLILVGPQVLPQILFGATPS